MRRWVIVGLIVLLAGCGHREVRIVEADNLDAVTPPPAILAAADLAPLIYQPGDLPKEYSLKTVTPVPSAEWKPPSPDIAWRIDFNHGIPVHLRNNGATSIFLYADSASGQAAYTLSLMQQDNLYLYSEWESLSGLGEQGHLKTRVFIGGIDYATVFIVFIRCEAVVFIHDTNEMSHFANTDTMLAYAHKIDQRLLDSPICAR